MACTVRELSDDERALLLELDTYLHDSASSDCCLDRRLVTAATLPKFRRALEIVGYEPLPMPTVERDISTGAAPIDIDERAPAKDPNTFPLPPSVEDVKAATNRLRALWLDPSKPLPLTDRELSVIQYALALLTVDILKGRER